MRTRDPAQRAAARCATIALAGALLSGPIGIALVQLRPQPAWTGPEAFARAYHPIQTIPYWFGFVLVGGSVGLIAALAASAREDLRARALAALALSSPFAALVSLNYVLQTTFVPSLSRNLTPETAPFVTALSLSNPRSLGWALEMWGYAVLGVATWLIAPALASRGRWGRAASALFVANGPVSIAGAVLTAVGMGWLLAPVGLALFATWNVLFAAMLALAIVALRSPGALAHTLVPGAP